jgi:hypothetical protein
MKRLRTHEIVTPLRLCFSLFLPKRQSPLHSHPGSTSVSTLTFKSLIGERFLAPHGASHNTFSRGPHLLISRRFLFQMPNVATTPSGFTYVQSVPMPCDTNSSSFLARRPRRLSSEKPQSCANAAFPLPRCPRLQMHV